MNLQSAPIQVPSVGKWHYFFYGACTEDQLSPMIATAEGHGCEYLSMVPMQVQVQASRLALANGQKTAQVVTLYRIFVRCPLADFPRIQELMAKDAQAEGKEGFRLT